MFYHFKHLKKINLMESMEEIKTPNKNLLTMSPGASILKQEKQPLTKSSKRVQFGEKSQIIVVENWKKYNVLVEEDNPPICSCNLL